jgi:hypothetical protein
VKHYQSRAIAFNVPRGRDNSVKERGSDEIQGEFPKNNFEISNRCQFQIPNKSQNPKSNYLLFSTIDEEIRLSSVASV